MLNFDEWKEKTDEEILALSVSRPSLFEILVGRYEDAFQRKARTILPEKEDAEDAVQETFVKIYMNAGRFKVQEGAKFSSWGYKILINTCLSAYKKKKRVQTGRTHVEEEVLYNFSDGVKTGEKEELHDLVARLLSSIPGHMSEAVELHYLLDFSQKEIADRSGESVAAVKTRIFRAKQELKKIYNDKYKE